MCLTFVTISNTSDHIIRPCTWSCDSFWKKCRGSQTYNLSGFFPLMQYLNLNLYYVMDSFCFISENLDWESILKYSKIHNFLKKGWFYKEIHNMFQTLAKIVTHWKKLYLMKKPVSFSILISFCNVFRKLPYQRMCSLHHQRLNKVKQSTWEPHRDGFLFSFAIFSVFMLVCFCLHFFALNFLKIKEKTSKM